MSIDLDLNPFHVNTFTTKYRSKKTLLEYTSKFKSKEKLKDTVT